MTAHALALTSSGAVDLNQPGTYLHWSIFEISVANLVVIAVMVVIFAAALLLPFPRPRQLEPAAPGAGSTPDPALGEDSDATMWTSRTRRWALRVLPPLKLLPDRQPGYVASWVYVFGVASLAALGVAATRPGATAATGRDTADRAASPDAVGR